MGRKDGRGNRPAGHRRAEKRWAVFHHDGHSPEEKRVTITALGGYGTRLTRTAL